MTRSTFQRSGFFRSVDTLASEAMDAAAKILPAPILAFSAYALFWPTLAWNHLMVRASGLQWFNEISVSPTGGRVLLGGYPWPAAIARGLANREKVEVVINTVAEREDKCFGDSVKVVRVPMRDFAEPSAKDVLACVAELDEAFKQGKTVYVHCKAGKGRSATVVLCWLVVRRGMSVEDAQALLSTRRPQVLKSLATRKVVREIVR